jgi:hypothetical protein
VQDKQYNSSIVVEETKISLIKNIFLTMKVAGLKLMLIAVITACATAVLGQTDTLYIKPFERKNFLQLYAGNFSRTISFTPVEKNGQTHEITVSPNSSAFCGFVLGYKKITLYGDVALPQTSKVNRSETDVRAFSFFMSHFKNKWGVTGFTSYNRGLLMAVDNMPMMYNSRSDLRKFTAGAHVYRIFNASKFSFVAANSQQMQQQKSAGSFIITLTPSYRILKSPQSIIPVEKSKYHLTGEMTMSRQLQLLSLQLKPGYAYNFVMKQGAYFVAPSFFAGPGADYHLLEQTLNKHNGFNFNIGYRFKLTAGINKQRYFATIEALADHTRSYLYRSVAKNTYRECSLNIGWRF